MAHLVRHHLANFGQRALLEQVVVQGDARGPEKSRDVRAYPGRLP